MKVDQLSTDLLSRYRIFEPLGHDFSSLSLNNVLCLFITFSILPLLIFIGSAIDGTLIIAGPGRGLLEHYGVLSIFICTPTGIVVAFISISKIVEILSNMERYSIGGDIPEDLMKIIQKRFDAISLNNSEVYILFLGIIVGGLLSIVNVKQTFHISNVMEIYGNDVFDCGQYFYGFFMFKVYFTMVQSIVCPILLYICLQISISLVLVIRYMGSNDLLKLDFYSDDQCGGVSEFGYVNALAITVYLLLGFISIMLILTHAKYYATLYFALLLVSAVIIGQSFGVVYYLHIFVKQKKELVLTEINVQLKKETENHLKFSRNSFDLLIVRSQIEKVRTFPYTRNIALFLNLFRYFPAGLAFVNLIVKH